jgi:fatty acid desaturase
LAKLQQLMNATTHDDILTLQQTLRQSVSQSQLQQWLKLQPLRAYRDLALDWGAIILALLAVAWMPVWWMYALAFLAIGTHQYKLFILAHDAIHGALHPQRSKNDRLASWFAYGPMFMALADARRSHLQHHRLMGTPEDPDRYLHTFQAKNTPFQFLLFCSGLATFGKTVLKVTPFGKLLQLSNPSASSPAPDVRDRESGEHQPEFPTNQTPTTKQSASQALIDYARNRVSVFIAQPLILGAFALLHLPLWSYLVLWVAPIYFLVFVPDEIRAFCDHAVLSFPDDRGDTQRLVTFRPGWLEAIVFAPHHMHYHAEHHLWPSIPHYNLPQAHEVMKGRPAITVRGGYLAFLRQVVRSLPLG